MPTADTLKKFGFPATVAAVIASAITITPFVFKIDERYAKAEALEQSIIKNDEKINLLTAEVGKLAGITEVLVTVIGQQRNALQEQQELLASRGNNSTQIARIEPLAEPRIRPYVDDPLETLDGALHIPPAPEPIFAPPAPVVAPPAPPIAPAPPRTIQRVESILPEDKNIDAILEHATENLQQSQRSIENIRDYRP